METIEERVTRLEETSKLIPEMRDDLKTVVAYVNQQKGKASISALIWTAVVALGSAALGGLFGATRAH